MFDKDVFKKFEGTYGISEISFSLSMVQDEYTQHRKDCFDFATTAMQYTFQLGYIYINVKTKEIKIVYFFNIFGVIVNIEFLYLILSAMKMNKKVCCNVKMSIKPLIRISQDLMIFQRKS